MKKLGLITLTMVVALGLLGVSYGLWFQNLLIDGQTKTGSWTWSFTQENPFILPGETTDLISSTFNGDNLTVNMSNPVSSHTYCAPFDIQSTGTVPIKVKSITFIGVPAGVTAIVDPSYLVGVGTQIDPGAIKMGCITITPGSYTGTIIITVAFEVTQWNIS